MAAAEPAPDGVTMPELHERLGGASELLDKLEKDAGAERALAADVAAGYIEQRLNVAPVEDDAVVGAVGDACRDAFLAYAAVHKRAVKVQDVARYLLADARHAAARRVIDVLVARTGGLVAARRVALYGSGA